MPDVALYYPYIHIRDDAWLKAAALCWPRLSRIVPPGHVRRDSSVARALVDELDFFVDVDPAGPARPVGREFLCLLRGVPDRVLERYRMRDEDVAQGGFQDNRGSGGDSLPSSRDRAWAYVHGSDVDDVTRRWLRERGLAVTRQRHGQFWLVMDSWLVTVYMTMLADEIARTNAMPVVTDELSLYGVLNGWRRDLLGELLLEDVGPAENDVDQVAETYALLAIRTYLPAGLADVPVERVIEARKVLLPEFYAFQHHLEALHDDFAELAQVQDSGVREAKLHLLLERKVEVPGSDLQDTLRKLGLQPANAVLSVQTPKLPGLTAAVAGGVPTAVAHGGAVAGRLVSAGLEAGQVAAQERRSAHGYLLGLREELTPRGVVDRVRRTFRHLRQRF